jgi:mono/diheme cytochrome c family protein
LVFGTGANAQNAVDGAMVFQNSGCGGCHGANGEGGIGPALAGNANLADAHAVVDQILHGGGGMPPFAQLTDEEIAAVAEFIRSSWGNAFAVTPAVVAERRAVPAPG